MKRVMFSVIGIVFLVFSLPAGANAGIIDTLHNLSLTGPGVIRALPGADPLDRICIFCHTPHNSAPRTPLWNKAIDPVSYELYTSTTLAATPSQPTGPSRLCLSCHDGTLALGATLMPAGGIATTAQLVGRPSHLGTNLSGDHPFSFSYFDSVANPLAGLSPTLPPYPSFYQNGVIHCTTCHDAHADVYRSLDKDGRSTGKFLVADNRYSALCVRCHAAIDGWDAAKHRWIAVGSLKQKDVLPVPPKKWPTWDTVAEWGCESCHTSHSAAGRQRLLYYPEEEKNCFPCHDGTVAVKDIKGQFAKASSHPVEATTGLHDPKEVPEAIANRHAECADCHNPHAANGNPATAPLVSGRLAKVSGVDANRAGLSTAVNEYEICFKCHADLAPPPPSGLSYVPRVIDSTNTRLEFSTLNPSYHPVIGIGRNPNVPSLPSSLEPTLTTSSIIYCTSCHSDDAGVSRGPHGSSYAPILRDRYETIDGTPESAAAYALCYRCHNQSSILSDASFRKKIAKTTVTGGGHSGHLAMGAPCSACHDPHGIRDNGLSGDHTNLINFDTRIVTSINPVFNDSGLFSGSCTLVCHGVTHTNFTYP